MSKYMVLDLETTIKNKGDESVGTFAASPFHPDNRVVSAVWLEQDWDQYSSDEEPDYKTKYVKQTDWLRDLGYSAAGVQIGDTKIVDPDDVQLLIGHNIAFDLHYLMKSSSKWREWVFNNGQIWDTMLVEYLITGQDVKFATLDSLAGSYGVTHKKDTLKEYLEAGFEVEEIPEDELLEYNIQDVYITNEVFKEQLLVVSDLDMTNLVLAQMDARLATIAMEHNGLFFDKEEAQVDLNLMQIKALTLHDTIANVMVERFDMEKYTHYSTFGSQITPTSPKQVSVLFFGGEINFNIRLPKTDEDGNVLRYKSGKKAGEIRYQNVNVHRVVEPLIDSDNIAERGKNGYFATDEEVLKKIITSTRAQASALATQINSLREWLYTPFVQSLCNCNR
jgi:DNA polymerase III epsilon subunit-like protein